MDSRIVFMGSPEFALPTLQALTQSYKVIGVITQPDRPAGRGRSLTPPPVKCLAQELGVPVIQPQRLRDPDTMQQLQKWDPDLIVVTAFGQILRKEVLELPFFGCINVHASLLPRWRGSAPIQAAILHGDRQSGVTIMKMDTGVDTGPILSQSYYDLGLDETSATLSVKLSQLGADLLIKTLPRYLDGSLVPVAQDDSQATYAPMLNKEDGRLDFSRPALALERLVRAFNPWPSASTEWQGLHLKINLAHAVPIDSSEPQPQPGDTLVYEGKPAFATIDGMLVLDEIQPAGKKSMPGEVFLRGARGWSASN